MNPQWNLVVKTSKQKLPNTEESMTIYITQRDDGITNVLDLEVEKPTIIDIGYGHVGLCDFAGLDKECIPKNLGSNRRAINPFEYSKKSVFSHSG